jgi:hypothetical protein
MRKFMIFLALLVCGVFVERAATAAGVLDSHGGKFAGLILAGSFFTIAFAAVVHK